MRRSIPISTQQIVRIKGKVRRELLPALTAKVAREELAKVQAVAPAPYRLFVDGREGAREDDVKPGGFILYEFQRTASALDWIWEQLVMRSPVGPDKGGHYRDDHWLFVNGVRVPVPEPGQPIEIVPGAEVMFSDLRPYARKLELGHSLQAPDGIYEMTAKAAKKQFPWLDIEFNYRAFAGGGAVTSRKRKAKSELRYPVIIIRVPK